MTIGYAAPPPGMTGMLATLAGTDGARQRRSADMYQLGLRRSLYPLVQREAVDPTPRGAWREKYSLSDPTSFRRSP